MTAATLRRGLRVVRREAVAIVTGRVTVDPPGSRFLCRGSGSEVLASWRVHAGRATCLTCGHRSGVVNTPNGPVMGRHDHEGRRL